MSNAKFIWNPIHKKVTALVNGRGVDQTCTDQGTLEKLYNRPKSEGLVIINPKWTEENVEVAEVNKDNVEFFKTYAVDTATGEHKQGCEDCDEEHPCEECEEKALVVKLKAEGLSNNKIKEQTGLTLTKIKAYLK